MPHDQTLEAQVRALYHQLLTAWNERDASAMAALYQREGNTVGFDGSQHDGAAALEATMARIFADHQTAAYVGVVREVRFLTPDVALLRAVVGMVPPGARDLNPAANAIQSLIAVREAQGWKIALFHNTPAQLHGRPEAVEALTDELRAIIPEQLRT